MENEEKTQKITQQIFDDAKRKGDRIISKAHRQAQHLSKDARKQAKEIKSKALAEAKKEAERTYQKILSSIPLEEKKIHLSAKDKIVNEVLLQIRHRLKTRSGFDYPNALKKLTVSAIQKMPGENFVLSFAEQDRAIFTDEFVKQITIEIKQNFNRTVKIELSDEFEQILGGVQVKDKTGRLFYDNSFEERMKRFSHQLREKIADIIFNLHE